MLTKEHLDIMYVFPFGIWLALFLALRSELVFGLVCFFESGSHCVSLTGMELTI